MASTINIPLVNQYIIAGDPLNAWITACVQFSLEPNVSHAMFLVVAGGFMALNGLANCAIIATSEDLQKAVAIVHDHLHRFTDPNHRLNVLISLMLTQCGCGHNFDSYLRETEKLTHDTRLTDDSLKSAMVHVQKFKKISIEKHVIAKALIEGSVQQQFSVGSGQPSVGMPPKDPRVASS